MRHKLSKVGGHKPLGLVLISISPNIGNGSGMDGPPIVFLYAFVCVMLATYAACDFSLSAIFGKVLPIDRYLSVVARLLKALKFVAWFVGLELLWECISIQPPPPTQCWHQ